MDYVFKKSGNSYLLDQKAELSDELPSAVYTVVRDQKHGIVFTKMDIVKDELIRVADSDTDQIVNFIANFTEEATKERYKKCKVTHKTGILLHGPAGTGKSATINLVVEDLVKKEALVFFDADPILIASILPIVRKNHPDRLICVVLEEFDEWLESSQATINSFLDGQLSVDNMIVLATTNYLSKIPARIKNRPSRFQLVKQIGFPKEDFRRAWFTQKLESIGESSKIEEFVAVSDEMSVDQMADLVKSNIALGIPLHEVVKKLQEMSQTAAGVDDYIEHGQKDALKTINDLFILPMGFRSIKKKDDDNPF